MLLGSASLTLQQGLADSLAGRYELIRADHWDLGECEKAFGWDLDTFLKFGGYPGCAELIADVPRWRAFIRDSVVEPVLLKDLLAMTAITKPALFRQTFELAMAYCDRPGDWRGRVLEAAVGAALCRRERSVYYWRDGREEVDYVVDTGTRLYAVEVKSGRIRGTSGLAAFMPGWE